MMKQTLLLVVLAAAAAANKLASQVTDDPRLSKYIMMSTNIKTCK